MRIPTWKSGTGILPGILPVSGLAVILSACLFTTGLAAQRVPIEKQHYRVWVIDRLGGQSTKVA